MRKEDLDKRICDVTNKSNLTMTYRDYIHQLDRNVYGEFAMSKECLDSLSELELNELLGKLEFLSND